MGDDARLNHSDILRLHRAAVSARLDASRTGLLAGLPLDFVAGLPQAATPGEQLLADLSVLNEAGVLVDGTVPLAIWLRNACALAGPQKESVEIGRILTLLESKSRPPECRTTERHDHLEEVHDWKALTAELEQRIASATDAGSKASLHLELGRVLEEKFLCLVPALKHFQDAYKLDPTLIEALRRARAVYWNLGKTNMVQRLLELELASTEAHSGATALLVELGDVYCDAGEWEKASTAYARALEVSAGESGEARDGVDDLKIDNATFRARIGLVLDGTPAVDTVTAARRYMRAARIAKRFAPAEVEGLLAHAYAADPRDKAAAAAYEQLLVDKERTGAILEAQHRILNGLSSAIRGEVAFRYGARWATRHQNPEVAVEFLKEALEYDPSIEGASWYLRDYPSKRRDN